MNKKSHGEKVNNHFTLLYNYIPQIDKYILWYMTLGLFKLFCHVFV